MLQNKKTIKSKDVRNPELKIGSANGFTFFSDQISAILAEAQIFMKIPPSYSLQWLRNKSNDDSYLPQWA